MNTAAFDAHRPNGTCRKPPDVGLVVAKRGVVWLESARHLERGPDDADVYRDLFA